MLSASHASQTEHQRVAQQYLEESLDALRKVYFIIYKDHGSHSKDKIEASLTALIEICFHKFDKRNNHPRFYQSQISSLIAYIEYLNKEIKTHHHARMLFQILVTFNQLSFKNEIMPDIRKDFLAELNKCPVIESGVPAKDMKEYTEFLERLARLKHFVEIDTVDKITHAVANNLTISDELASALFYAARGAGDSVGKKFADMFMDNIVKVMPDDKLFELTAGVMRAHTGSQVVGAELPFLRATGFITDRLYWECSHRVSYDSRSKPNAEMTKLNKELLIGKGYDFHLPTDRTDRQQKESAANAIVEMDFKINSGAMPTNPDKIVQEIRDYLDKQKSKLPPPLPMGYRKA